MFISGTLSLALMSFCQVVLGLEVLGQLLGKIGRGELDGCFHQNLVIWLVLYIIWICL